MTRPSQTPPPEQQQAPPQALPPGPVADRVGVAAGAAAVAPVVAGAVAQAAITAATAKIIDGLLSFFHGRRSDDSIWLAQALRRDYPQRTVAQIDQLVSDELTIQHEFERRVRARLERDLPKALKETDPEKRREAVDKIMERERRYLEMRQRAMIERASARAEHMDVKLASPDGAYWKLDPTVKAHTLDCVAMGEKFWPWEVLDKIYPLLHTGCQCHLYTRQEAVERGWMLPNYVVDVKDAVTRANSLMKHAHKLMEAALPGEVEAFIAQRLEEAARGPRTPQACHYFREGCEERARKSLIWAENRAYIPVCDDHEATARASVKAQHDEVNRVVLIEARQENQEILEGASVKGAMIALYPSAEAAAALAVKGGDAPETLHVTLKFLGEDASKIKGRKEIEAALAAWAKTAKPLAGRVVGVGEFKPNPNNHPDEKPIYAKPDIPGVQAFRKSLVAALPASVMEDTFPEYKPHITLRYAPVAEKLPAKVEPVPLVFDRVYLVWSEERTAFMLGTGERIEEAEFEERLHPRGRGGRFIRVHLKSGKTVILGNVGLGGDRRIRGVPVDERGYRDPSEQDGMYHLDEVDKIDELQHDYGKGDGAKLVPRETLAGPMARDHLNVIFHVGFDGSERQTWPLTEDERAALDMYRHDHGYQAINNALRGHGDMNEKLSSLMRIGREPKTLYSHSVEEWVGLTDSAIAKAPRTGAPISTFVYRGIRDTAAVFGGEPKVGQRVTDPAYVSTTTDSETARRFATAAPHWALDDKPVDPSVIEIAMPSGTQGAWMGGAFGLEQYGSEFVLPRGSHFEVTNVRHDLGNKPGEMLRVIEARLVVGVQEAAEGIAGAWLLEESEYQERLHPRGRAGEWIRKPIFSALRKLTPQLKPANVPEHRAPLQERGSEQGRYVWLRGRYVFVPRHRVFHRKLDGVEFRSPAGGTNIYRNGYLVQVEGQGPPPHHQDLNAPAQPDIRNVPGTAEYSPSMTGEKGGGMLDEVPTANIEHIPAVGSVAELQQRERTAIYERTQRALRDMNEDVQPIHVGDHVAAVDEVLEASGFRGGKVHQDGRLATTTYTHWASGATTTISWNTGGFGARAYAVTDVHDWKPGRRGWDAPAPPLGRSPRTWEEFADEVRGVAYRLAHEHDQEPVVGEVVLAQPGQTYRDGGENIPYGDHSGTHNSWDGRIILGPDVPDVLKPGRGHGPGEHPVWYHGDTTRSLEGIYGGYKVGVHEAIHGAGNGIAPPLYATPIGKGIEEAVTEELAHIEAAKLLRENKVTEPLGWLRANPRSPYALGTYRAYRFALDRAMNVAGVAPELREDYIRDLKWNVAPEDRFRKIVDDVVAGPDASMSPSVAGDYVRYLFTSAHEQGLGSEKFMPILRPDLTDFPGADGVLWDGKPIRVGSRVSFETGVREEKRDARGKLRSRWVRREVGGRVLTVEPTNAPGFTFKMAVQRDDGLVMHNVLDSQVKSVPFAERPTGPPSITLRDAVMLNGQWANVGSRVEVDEKDSSFHGESGEVTRISRIGDETALMLRTANGNEVGVFADTAKLVSAPGQPPETIAVGDTITYDGRADGGRSEALVVGVHDLNVSPYASKDTPRYAIEAITTDNSLKPGTFVYLTDQRMNGVEVKQGTVTQLPERARPSQPFAVAADRSHSMRQPDEPMLKVKFSKALLNELMFLEGDTADGTGGPQDVLASMLDQVRVTTPDWREKGATLEVPVSVAEYLHDDALPNAVDVWADNADPEYNTDVADRRRLNGYMRQARTLTTKLKAATETARLEMNSDAPRSPANAEKGGGASGFVIVDGAGKTVHATTARNHREALLNYMHETGTAGYITQDQAGRRYVFEPADGGAPLRPERQSSGVKGGGDAFADSDRVMAALGAHEVGSFPTQRPDQYMIHPRSGFQVRNPDVARTTVINDYGKPPRVHDTKVNRFGNEEEVPGTVRPPTHLFRAVSEEEYQDALKSGYLQSDGRMNLISTEGTVAALSDPTYYLPGKLASSPHGEHLGRVLRIAYRDEDGWKLDTDGYVKTPERIPISRVDAAPQFVTTKETIPSSITGSPVEHISSRPTGIGMERPGEKGGGDASAVVPASWPERGLDWERRWDALPDDTRVWLFHATDRQTAERMAADGIDPSGKPMTLARRRFEAGEYAQVQPGAGAGAGLYVGYEPWSISGYGREMIAVNVRKGDVEATPEQAGARIGDALRVNDAQVRAIIPPSDVHRLTLDGRVPTRAILAQLPSGEKGGGETIPDDQRVYIAEGAMKRGGLDGGVLHNAIGHADHPTAEGRASSAAMTKLAREISGDPRLRVNISNWISGPGGDQGHAVYDATYHSVTIRPESDKLTFLHEVAHAMTRTEHGVGGHGPEFVATAEKLYREHIGNEAADLFASLAHPPAPKPVWPQPIPVEHPRWVQVGPGVLDSEDGRMTMYRIEGVRPTAWNVEWTTDYEYAVSQSAYHGLSSPLRVSIVDGAASRKDATALALRAWPETRANIVKFETQTVRESADQVPAEWTPPAGADGVGSPPAPGPVHYLLEVLGVPEEDELPVIASLLAMPRGSRTEFVAEWLSEAGAGIDLARILG